MRSETPKPSSTQDEPAPTLYRLHNCTFRVRPEHNFRTFIETLVCSLLAMNYCVNFTHMVLSFLLPYDLIRLIMPILMIGWAIGLMNYLPLIFKLEPINQDDDLN